MGHLITAYYSGYRPRKDKRLSRPGWLVTYRNKVPLRGVEPGNVTHPSINRARCRVTSLIRLTPLPLRHAANHDRHCPVWLNGRAFACDPKGRGFDRTTAGPHQGNSLGALGQATHTHVPLSPSSIIWYRLMGSDAFRLGR